MMNWLVGLSSPRVTEEDLLNETLREMRVEELQKLAFDVDPTSRPTHVDELRDKIFHAEKQGRELAHEHGTLDKIAFLPALAAGAGRLLAGSGAKSLAGGVVKDMAISGAANKVMGALKPAAPAASAAGEVAGGFKYAGIAGNVASAVAKPGLGQQVAGFFHRNPGAAMTFGGAALGAAMAPRDPQTGQKQYLRGALVGGGVAAGANAVSGGRIADNMKRMVTRQNNPVFGQGVRRYATEAAYATRPKVVPTGAAAPTAAAPAASEYMGGPTMGNIKVAEQAFMSMSPAQQILFVAGGGTIEKTALLGVDDVAGGMLGYMQGKHQAERGEKHNFGGLQLASLLLPGGAGYQVGRALGHSKEKKANQQTLTYDPATKTFTRQHLTPSAGSNDLAQMGARPIPAGHTEPVRSTLARAARPAGVPPPIPAAARRVSQFAGALAR